MSAQVGHRPGSSVRPHGRPRRRGVSAPLARRNRRLHHRGRAARQALVGRAIAGEARARPHRVGHPPRVGRRAAQAPPVPGPRPRRSPHHRRLHGPGRRSQRQGGKAPQVVLTTPLLVGIGGGEKMSKSLGNHVGITEPPDQQFGKLMRIPDEVMPQYFELATGWGADRVAEAIAAIERAEPADRARLKRELARTVVDLYHGEGAGAAAESEFDRVFKDHAAPTDVQEYVIPPEELRDGRIEVARLLTLGGLAASNREGRRKIQEGGVYLEDDRVTDASLEVTPSEVDGRLLRLGRRSWIRLRA